VTLVNTGLETMTGGRVKRVQHYLDNEPFLLTYGDGVADVNIRELVDFHRSHGKLATVTSAQPSGRFGALERTADNIVRGFQEKPKGDGGWINAGFFVMEPGIFNSINDDSTVFEKTSLVNIAKEGELKAYKHSGFWQCMDKLSDKALLEELWDSGKAPWRLWKNKTHD